MRCIREVCLFCANLLCYHVCFSASIRRSSMRGDRKSELAKKEHKEEALHFGLNLMHDEESLMVIVMFKMEIIY